MVYADIKWPRSRFASLTGREKVLLRPQPLAFAGSPGSPERSADQPSGDRSRRRGLPAQKKGFPIHVSMPTFQLLESHW